MIETNEMAANETVLSEALNETTLTEPKVQAKMKGADLHFPADLYIPPDALEVVLEVFEGPLDLLLYLIKKHNLDVLDIPVAEITKQYMDYIALMTVFRLNLASDYLEMAAFLAEVKSRMLLPRPENTEEEEDPRAELVRRLKAYEQFKKAAENLDALPRMGRDLFPLTAAMPEFTPIRILPDVQLKEILLALKDVLKRIDLQAHHIIKREVLSVRERMTIILSRLENGAFSEFVTFFEVAEGRLGVVVTFLAILELLKEGLIVLVQTETFGPIYLRIPDVHPE